MYFMFKFFVPMLFEGTSARKHKIDKELPYLVMTNHSKIWKPFQKNSIMALFQQMRSIIITHKFFYMLCFAFQVKKQKSEKSL